MYLEHLLPSWLAIAGAPRWFWYRFRYPKFVSFGLLANLASLKKRGLFDRIDAVIDIGANCGQFAFMMSRVRPDLLIYSFEPNPPDYDALVRNFSRFRIRGRCFPLALTDEEGEQSFHLYDSSVNNSLLSRKDVPVKADRVISVHCRRLDGFFPIEIDAHNVLLKIDVQGAELAVLEGAAGILDRCQWVLVEVSFVSAYQRGADALEVALWLGKHGFRLFDLVDTLRLSRDYGSGLREADLLFIRVGSDEVAT